LLSRTDLLPLRAPRLRETFTPFIYDHIYFTQQPGDGFGAEENDEIADGQ